MGRLGKDNSPRQWAGSALLLLALAGCALGGPDGRYAGPVDVEQGMCGPAAGGQHMVGSLQIRGEEAIFAPDQGVLLLRGQIDKSGHVTASTTTPGADHKPFLMVFEGDVRGKHVEGRYATPRCRATVRLDRAD